MMMIQTWINTALGGSAIVLFVLSWWRYKHLTKARVSNIDADSFKTLAEGKKVMVQADAASAEEWQKIAKRLEIEIEHLKQREIDLIKQNERVHDDCEAKIIKEKAEADIIERELRNELRLERERNDSKINSMFLQLIELTKNK